MTLCQRVMFIALLCCCALPALAADMYQAARAGELETVRTLLKAAPASVNVTADARGTTPLHIAIAKGYPAVAQALVAGGADVKAVTVVGATPLHFAVMTGSAELATLLLAHGAEVNAADINGVTPLQLAAWNGNQRLVELLAVHQATLNCRDNRLWSPLHFAAWQGHEALVCYFVAHGLDINAGDVNGWTPLHLAVATSHGATVQYLLAQHADVKARDIENQTPLMWALGQRTETPPEQLYVLQQRSYLLDACDYAQAKAVLPKVVYAATDAPTRGEIDAARQPIIDALFAAQQGDPQFGRNTPGLFTLAAAAGQTALMEYLLLRGVDVNARPPHGDAPLLAAAAAGRVAAVDWLLAHQADVAGSRPDSGWTALHCAAQNGQEAIVAHLLQAGAAVDTPDRLGSSPLYYALKNRQLAVVRCLLDHGANINTRDGYSDREPLGMLAVRTGDVTLLERLLAAGLDTGQHDAAGATLLHTAVKTGAEAMVTLLLAKGAEVNAVDNDGNPPLFLAPSPAIADLLFAKGAKTRNEKRGVSLLQSVGTPEMLDWCLAHGMTVDEPGVQGATRLYTVAGQTTSPAQVTALTARLLEKGANPNAPAADGATPLHMAVSHGLAEVVALLLDHGANANLPNRAKQTPLLLAINAGNGLQKVKLLLEHAADPNQPDAEGNTPLHKAVEQNEPLLVDVLFAHHANQNLANNRGQTPLLLALAKGQTAQVTRLLAEHPNLQVEDQDGGTPVAYAIAQGANTLTAELLTRGATTTGKQRITGDTPLHQAARQWDGSIIVEKPVEIRPQSSAEKTPPLDPTKAIGKELVTSLLQHGAAVDARNADGDTPLCLAAKLGHIATARLLLEHGANPRVKNNAGETPLWLAVARNCVAIARMLAEKGVTLDNSLFFCAQRGEIMDYLAAHGLKPIAKDAAGNLPIQAALWADSASTMEELLKHGADATAKNADGLTAVQILDAKGDEVLIADRTRKYLLLLAASEKNCTTRDAEKLLHTATSLDEFYVADLLLAKGMNIDCPDIHGDTPLYAAIRARNLRFITYLLQHKCRVNIQNKKGQTPLHLALLSVPPDQKTRSMEFSQQRKDTPEVIGAIVQQLLAHGADPLAADGTQQTPLSLLAGKNPRWWPLMLAMAMSARQYNYQTQDGLTLWHLAAVTGRQEAIAPLLAAKCDVNAVDKTGNTPLHLAIYGAQKAMVALLLKNKANVTRADQDGLTPLHALFMPPPRYGSAVFAAGFSPNDLCDLIIRLLASGAQINARDSNGNTPLTLAKKAHATPDILNLLSAKGGKE